VSETDPSQTPEEEADQSHSADPSEPSDVPTGMPGQTGDGDPENGPGDATPR
jgi:hypothetical protein